MDNYTLEERKAKLRKDFKEVDEHPFITIITELIFAALWGVIIMTLYNWYKAPLTIPFKITFIIGYFIVCLKLEIERFIAFH